MSQFVYPLWSYGRMIADLRRMKPYAEAIRRSVRADDIVFDLGAGPGVFALLAARSGARAAVAVEVDPSVRLASRLAAENGLSGKVHIFEGLSTDFAPSERADVIIADLRGSLPLYGPAIPSWIDARERLLKAGGILIPRRDRLKVALIESERVYRDYAMPWRRNELGLNLGSGARFVTNYHRAYRARPEECLSAAMTLAELDYRVIASPDLDCTTELTAMKDGTAHGYLIWFETELIDGVGFATGPETPSEVYRQMFFPLEQPLVMTKGESVILTFGARLVEANYRFHWRTVAEGRGGRRGRDFRQASDFARLYAYDLG